MVGPDKRNGRFLPAGRFDALCRIARQLFDVPVAAIWVDGNSVHAAAPAMAAVARALPLADIAQGLPDRESAPLWVSNLQEPQAAGLPFRHQLPDAIRFFACVGFGPGDCAMLVLLDDRPRRGTEENAARLRNLRDLANQLFDQPAVKFKAAGREGLFRLLTETSTDTIVHGNLSGERLYVSPSARSLLGYDPAELIGKKAIDITHPDDRPRFAQLLAQIRDGSLDIGAIDIRQRHKDGSWVWMEASVRLTCDEATGEPNGYVASVRNLTRRKALETQLERQAHYDDLTGLPNRALFAQSFHAMIELARRENRCLALLYMDLDGFKRVNDRRGHRVGDAVLREAASRFLALMRVEDIVARLGGDEFAALVLLPRAKLARLAERLIGAAKEPYRVDGIDVVIGLSIGIALYPDHASRPEAMLEMADAAMYRAKAAGKCAYRVHDAACAHAAPPAEKRSRIAR